MAFYNAQVSSSVYVSPWDLTPFTTWLALPPEHPNHRCLSICSPPGCGRSCIAAALLQQHPAAFAAYFFVTSLDVRTTHALHVIRTLTYRLALSLPAYAHLLLSLLSADLLGLLRACEGSGPCAWQQVFRALLYEPLHWLAGSPGGGDAVSLTDGRSSFPPCPLLPRTFTGAHAHTQSKSGPGMSTLGTPLAEPSRMTPEGGGSRTGDDFGGGGGLDPEARRSSPGLDPAARRSSPGLAGEEGEGRPGVGEERGGTGGGEGVNEPGTAGGSAPMVGGGAESSLANLWGFGEGLDGHSSSTPSGVVRGRGQRAGSWGDGMNAQ